MIDEDMLCMALFPVICGPQESLDGLVNKLREAVQNLGNTRVKYLRQRAADCYGRYSNWGLSPIGMIADDSSETVHWQVMGDHMGVETPACACTTNSPDSWTFRRTKHVRITCPECKRLLAYAKKAVANAVACR